MKRTEEEKYLQRDRMIYSNNKRSANLTYLAILFDVLFFVSIYRSDVGSYYYNILIGASIVYNLLFMLAAFLSSQGVKNRISGYSYVLIVLGVLQIVRIFILPIKAHGAVVSLAGVETVVMDNKQFICQVIFLVCSSVCLLIAAISNLVQCRELENHLSTKASKEA